MITYNNNNNEIVTKIRKKFNSIQSNHLKNVFKNTSIILSQKQPKKILRVLSNARFNTDTNIQPKGLFKRTDKRCKICLLYINEGNNFVMYNNMRWEFRSHLICRGINVIYYLKCNMCDHKETFPFVNFLYANIIVPRKINV